MNPRRSGSTRRGSPSFDVWHRQKRGYSGKCLPKDVDAFVNAFNIPLMKVVKNINDKLLKNK